MFHTLGGFQTQEGLDFRQKLEDGITRRHKPAFLEYAKSQIWNCANEECCNGTTRLDCKAYLMPDMTSLRICFATPQCGDELCRIILQREAENHIRQTCSSYERKKTLAGKLLENCMRECEVCGKKDALHFKLYMCIMCKATYYCSEKHQKEHWKVHKKGCKLASFGGSEKKSIVKSLEAERAEE